MMISWPCMSYMVRFNLLDSSSDSLFYLSFQVKNNINVDPSLNDVEVTTESSSDTNYEDEITTPYKTETTKIPLNNPIDRRFSTTEIPGTGSTYDGDFESVDKHKVHIENLYPKEKKTIFRFNSVCSDASVFHHLKVRR